MAAGLGFKDFVTGEVLTAADVDGYLMQGVWVFASAAARDSAVTSPQEGNFAYLKDTNVTTYYTGSAWANLDTTGMTNPMTTTGDTIYSSSGSTPARLGIGSTGNVLTVAGGVPTWAAPAGGGGMTLLSTTTLSGASTTVSSISGSYKNLYILIVGVNTASDSVIRLLPNGSSTLVDSAFAKAIQNTSENVSGNWSDVFMLSADQTLKAADTNNIFTCEILDYANSSQYKLGNYSAGLVRTTSSQAVQTFGNGRIKTTSAITSIAVTSGTGNFNGGTMYVYGVS